MLAKGYLYGSHYLPHDAMATQTSGKTFVNELVEHRPAELQGGPANDMIFGSASTGCARSCRGLHSASRPANTGLEALCNYHAVRQHRQDLAVDEPVHDWASHAASALKVIAEAEMAGMLHSAGSTANFIVDRSRFELAFAAMHGTTPVPPTFWIAFSASRDETCA